MSEPKPEGPKSVDFSAVPPEPPEPQRAGGGRLAIAIVAVVALLGAGLFLYRRSQVKPVTPPPAPVAQLQPAPKPQPAPAPAPAPVAPLPPADQTDAQIRGWAQRVSSSPRLAGWLAGHDWLRRVTALINTLSEGHSPRALLPFLAPHGAFRVARRHGHKVIAPASYARYDAATKVVASVDPAVASKAWHALHPVLEAAWHEIARPGRTLDQGLSEALTPLIEVKVPKGPVAVVPKGLGYAFADPKLESLTAAQKILVRMGARNAARVQAKLRAFLAAVGAQASAR